MKLTDVDILPDELRAMAMPDKFKNEIGYEDTQLSMDIPICIKYDYLDLEDTEYHFNQSFHHRDTQCYFKMMKMISSSTINSLMKKEREYHFYRSKIAGNLKRVLQQSLPEAVNSNPIVFHFALYTAENADRTKDVRSPRIYFLLGTNGFIYPLFFDPYHEINP